MSFLKNRCLSFGKNHGPVRTKDSRISSSARPSLEGLEDRLALTGITHPLATPFGRYETKATALNLGALTRDVDRADMTLDGQADWFRFQTKGVGGSNDRVFIQSNSGGANLELRIYDAKGKLVGGVGGRAVDYDAVRLFDQPAGVYFAKVTGKGGATGISYQFHVDAPVAIGTKDDQFKSNNTAFASTGIGYVGPKGLAINAQLPRGDEDWYSFRLSATAGAGSRVVVNAPLAWKNGLNLEVYDNDGKLVNATSGASGIHAVSLEGMAAGRYRVHIFTDANAGVGAYKLSVSAKPVIVNQTIAKPQSGAKPQAAKPQTLTVPATPFAQITNPAIRQLVQTYMADGQLSREDWIQQGGILQTVQADGAVSSTEFASLQWIVNNSGNLDGPNAAAPGSSPIMMYNYVSNLMGKLVNGDAANAVYQGTALGNLAVGSTSTQLGLLINKWFLGLDRPTAGKNTTYMPASSNPLFGSSGPEVSDINQGDAGDCYFLSSAGTILSRQLTAGSGVANYISVYDPQSGANPSGLYIDNGDGTWTVRFYYQNQTTGAWVPDYVTVDEYFPTTGTGKNMEWNYANAYYDFSDTTLPIWVPLLEKAYCQENASARWVSPGDASSATNSYNNISGKYYGSQAMMQISGQDGYLNTTNLSSLTFEAIVAGYQGGIGVVFGSNSNPPADPTNSDLNNSYPLVSDHDYMMVGFNEANQTIQLRNPWGDQSLSGTYDSLNPPTHPNETYLLIDATVAFLQSNFNGYYHINPQLITS